MFTLEGHTNWVLCVSWSPDAKVIATGSYDNTVMCLAGNLTGSYDYGILRLGRRKGTL